MSTPRRKKANAVTDSALLKGCQSSRQDLGLGCLTGHGSHVPVKMAAVAGAAGGLDTSVKDRFCAASGSFWILASCA